MRVDKVTEDFYAKKHDGDVFAQVYFMKAFSEYWLSKDYYTIKDGVVHIIEQIDGKQKLTKSGDSVWECCQLELIGKYDPNTVYQKEHRTFKYHQVNRLFKTKKKC